MDAVSRKEQRQAAQHSTIRDAIERAVSVFDFLRGEEPYKYGFGPSPEDVLNIKVSP